MSSGFIHIKEHRGSFIGWTKVDSIPIARKIYFPNLVLLLQNFQEMFSYFIPKILALVIGSCDPA